MLPENYPSRSDAEKRLLAVNAALELIKASVAARMVMKGAISLPKISNIPVTTWLNWRTPFRPRWKAVERTRRR